MGEIIWPSSLAPGDTVGVIAPASHGDPSKLQKAIAFLHGLGLQVRLGEAIEERYGYLAGTDQARLDDLHRMFADKEIKAIICARGGYGTGRIASQIDYDLIRDNPKIFWGYSDITFLLNAIYQQTGLITFHGPMLTSDVASEDVHPLTLQTFEQLFYAQELLFDEQIAPLQTLVEGEAEGIIVGGNLSLLVTTLGTQYEIDTKDKLLFIEDTDEEPYRIDRMLNHLKMAGKLEDAAGILVCDFNNCGPNKREASLSLEQVIDEYITSAGKPAMQGFPIGHCSPNLALPIGVLGKINTYEKSFAVKWPGVSGKTC